MDGRFNFLGAQGSKQIKQDLTANILELQVDRGLVFEKGRGSLARKPG
jgi:hypothetical protein